MHIDTQLRDWVFEQVEKRGDWFVELCQKLVQIPTPNPPGDTTHMAVYIKGLLDERGILYAEYAPKAESPNIVTKLGSGDSPKLSLNGHMDVFPVGDISEWTDNPYSGAVRDGRLYGRGSSDMKAGVAAALGTFLMMAEENVAFDGTVVLSLVSDEETGSKWGAWWLADNVPEILGDACLIGEPTGCLTPVIGQKAPYWVRITTHSKAQHGAFNDGRDAVWQMAKIIVAIQTLNDLVYDPPAEIASLTRELKRQEREAGSGNEWWFEHPSVNFGRISGGLKVNIVPSSCELELDLRIPFGATSGEIHKELERRLAEAGADADLEVITGERDAPNFTDPNDPYIRLVVQAIQETTGREPQPVLRPYFTDGRVFRMHGVPTVSCGPMHYNMAGPDEHILIEEYLQVVRVFALTTAVFCGMHLPSPK